MASTSDMFRTSSGDFDLRSLVVATWEGAPTTTMEDLKSCWQPKTGVRTGDELYELEFKRHWEDLDQTVRDAELRKIIQFQNRLVSGRVEDSPKTRCTAALLEEKMRMLSWANDTVYGNDYVGRLFRDPRQFWFPDPPGQSG
jgi:hypothetical protein